LPRGAHHTHIAEPENAIFKRVLQWHQLCFLLPKWGAMKLDAEVRINEGTAHFSVSPKGPGMYQAKLIRFNGMPEEAPPSRIILVRSVRQWTGSCDNEKLLNELGQVIDRIVSDAPIFKKDADRRSHGRNASPDQARSR
jgi:hypothetical protein